MFSLSHALTTIPQELLYSYQDVCQQLQKSVPKRNAELQEIESLRYREQRYAENVRRMQFLLDRDPFVLVLIDAGNSTTVSCPLVYATVLHTNHTPVSHELNSTRCGRRQDRRRHASTLCQSTRRTTSA